MCGIFGIIKTAEARFDISQNLIQSATDTMGHRGPDGSGWWISQDRKMGLGHRRLSIVDLSEAGKQPMSNRNGKLWITYNGEIYNHLKIRSELSKLGYQFKSRTDTETILCAYEAWGIDCIHRLEGMFAFGLWDSGLKSLYLVRDRIGVKPLYYAELPGGLMFSSEIKALLQTGFISKEINQNSVYHYLSFMTTPAPETMFQGIKKITNGSYLKFCEGQPHQIVSYWNPIQATSFPSFKSEGEEENYYVENIRNLLHQAVEKRMMSDVPFGVFLSGGVDSSLNTAFMSRCISEPVKTLSVGYYGSDTSSSDELPHARRISKLFKTDHYEVQIGFKEVSQFVDDMVFYQDEPIADPVCVPIYYVSKLARDNGIKVVNVGEGSDEIFSGYDYWKNTYYWSQHKKRVSLMAGIFGPVQESPIRNFAYHQLNRLVRYHLPPDDIISKHRRGQEYFWGGAIMNTDVEKRLRWFSKDFCKMQNGEDSYQLIEKIYREARSRFAAPNILSEWAYLDLNIRLPELLLMRVDKMGMAASVEGRVPFLDHKLVEFALRIPSSWKIKNNTGKYILKKAAEGILPHEIIYRKKMGFPSPLRSWFKDGLFPILKKNILESKLVERNYFNYTSIKRELDKFQRHGNADCGNLWLIMNLSMWYDRWIA